MKQYGLLAAAFGVTLAVLLVGFLVFEQMTMTSGVAQASPSPSPDPTDVAVASNPATARPSASPSPSLPFQTRPPPPSDEPSEAPSATPRASGPTPKPTPTPAPIAPGSKVDVVVPGANYVAKDVPHNGKVTRLANGGVLLETTRDYSEQLQVTWKLPVKQLPAGMKVGRVDVAVCGNGSGDFWETYGPAGADPYEYEVVPPGSDGCYHYLGGTISDTAVFAIIRLQSRFQIDRLVYTAYAR